ncbi:MAG: cobalamin biosynthesis protein, partial [Desulfovibrio sp.]|nr:cobalamin biosynthesis protein [Desulfovibrio sp.]
MPYSVFDCFWLAPLALVMDLWLGDPALPWKHPVVLIGKIIAFEEKIFRSFIALGKSAFWGRLYGLMALCFNCT